MNKLAVRRRVRVLENRMMNGIQDSNNLLESIKMNDDLSVSDKKDLEFEVEVILARQRNMLDNLKTIGQLIMEDDDETS